MLNKKLITCILMILICVLQCSLGYCKTQQKIATVLLPFSDNTQYFRNGYDRLFEELILESFFDIDKFDILERKNDEDSIRLYNQISIRRESVRELLKEKNFLDVIRIPKRDISRQEKDVFLSNKITDAIGNKNNVNFLIHGCIDYLGKDRTYNNIAGISKKGYKLTVVATVRILVSESGKVIWYKRLKETSSESSVDYSGFKIGTSKLSDKLFYDLFTELSEKFAIELSKDLDANKIKF